MYNTLPHARGIFAANEKSMKAKLNLYLTFDGNTEKAFELYRSVLGGEFTSLQRFGDTPHGEHMGETDKKKIMHLTLQMPNGTLLMGNDHLEGMGAPYVAGNNFSVSLHPETVEESDRLFKGLSAGGQVLVPLDRVFWGAYFGMFVDRFGVKWIVNHEPKK